MTYLTAFKKVILVSALLCLSMTITANSAKPLTLILDWFVNPTDGPVLVAQEQHFFQRVGLKVNIINPADPDDTAKLVALGKADIGIGSDPHMILAIGQGLPLLRAGTLIDQPMIAVASYDAKTLQELKGKTIGYPVGDLEKFILEVMLNHVGLQLKDVNLIDVHFNLVQALLSKKVDAITGAMRDYEVPQIEMEGMKVHSFYPEDYGMPRYAELSYIINVQHRNDPRISLFLTAIKSATHYINQHPEAAWQGIIAEYPQLDTALNKKSWQMTYPLFAKDPATTHRKNFMQLVTLMQQKGWLAHVQSYHDYVV